MITRRGAVATSLSASLAGRANAQTTPSIVGTWRYVSITEETGTDVVHHPFGESPMGLLVVGSDGYFAFTVTNSDRQPLAGPKATDAEAAHLWRTMAAGAGPYRIEGDAMINHYDTAWTPAWLGTDQKRFVKIEGDRLTIRSPSFVSSISGKQVTVTAVLERVKRV